MLESSNTGIGQEYLEGNEEMYCSQNILVAAGYARPQILFKNNVFIRFIVKVTIDGKHKHVPKKKQQRYWTVPTCFASIAGVFAIVDAPRYQGEGRLWDWDPKLEAVPVGKEPPQAIRDGCTY